MANGLFNIARGATGYYSDATRGLAGTAEIKIVVLQVAEADDTLNNYDTLAAVLAGSNTEVLSTGYSRKLLDSTDITWTVDDTGNDAQAIVDADQTWTSVSQAASESWVKLLVCHGANGAADSAIIPLTHHDFSVTPNGGDVTANFDQTAGFYGST